jgi:hypothetical protein
MGTFCGILFEILHGQVRLERGAVPSPTMSREDGQEILVEVEDPLWGESIISDIVNAEKFLQFERLLKKLEPIRFSNQGEK